MHLLSAFVDVGVLYLYCFAFWVLVLLIWVGAANKMPFIVGMAFVRLDET